MDFRDIYPAFSALSVLLPADVAGPSLSVISSAYRLASLLNDLLILFANPSGFSWYVSSFFNSSCIFLTYSDLSRITMPPPFSACVITMLLSWLSVERGSTCAACRYLLCRPGLYYYGFQTVCKCPFRALLVTSATDSNRTWAN